MNETLKPKQKGFTLIELVVVIVISGIIAAIMAPRYVDLKNPTQTVANKASAKAVGTAWEFQYMKLKMVPTLSQLASGVEVDSSSAIPAPAGNGVCIGTNTIVLTYKDSEETIPTTSAADPVMGVANNGSTDAGCP